MKIRSLLLGSVAVAGLSTAGFAADLGVVTSLDVCDELGLSGLTISSDSNCLVITGNVKFEYDWGNYQDRFFASFDNSNNSNFNGIEPYTGPFDFNSNLGDVDAWLKFVGTADSDFGPATATIKLISENGTGTSDWTVGIDEAWVGIGDTTQLMAGYKSSIFNNGDDEPLNYLGLFNSSSVNTGVSYSKNVTINTGGDVIQVVSNLGNGISIGGGIEGLGSTTGGVTAVGVLAYAGDGVTAHVSTAYNTYTADWALHAGFTGAWDPIKVVGAFAADSSGYYDALGSVSATFDMFTIAASAEAASDGVGAGASVSATVTDGVTINLGGRYWTGNEDVWQAEAGVKAAVTDTVTLSGAIGVIDGTFNPGYFYAKGGVDWAPGGGFTAGSSLTVTSDGAYKAVFTAAKSIK